MTFEQIMTTFKQKSFLPIYFLTGEEHYYMDQISDYAANNLLDEAEQAFNLTVIYGKKDLTISSIVDNALRYPMMAAFQVLIVREAQQMDGWDSDIFLHYIQNPQPLTVLVICYRNKILKTTKLGKALSAKNYLSEFTPLRDYKMPDWISQYVSQHGYKITPPASVMLADYLGTDLSKVANELDKLFILIANPMVVITPEIIERNVGISKNYNVFELQSALTNGDILKANRIIDYFDKNPKSAPMVLVISGLYSYFVKIFTYHSLNDNSQANVAKELKINPYFVKDYAQAARRFPAKKISQIFSYLREYDLKSKGVGNVTTTQGQLLKELLFKILH